jgi:hypothetical protein
MTTTHRIAVAPFLPIHDGVRTVVGDLAPKGFRAEQFCLVGTPSAIAPLASPVGSTSLVYPQLIANLEPLHVAASSPLVVSPGPIADILLRQQSWLASPAAAPLRRHLDDGKVVLGVNGLDHGQFLLATRLMLQHADGDLLTHIFQWPQTP